MFVNIRTAVVFIIVLILESQNYICTRYLAYVLTGGLVYVVTNLNDKYIIMFEKNISQ